MMRFDKSHITVVVTCTQCHLWAEIADNMTEAARVSEIHETQVHHVHAGATQGYGIRYQATRRRAQT